MSLTPGEVDDWPVPHLAREPGGIVLWLHGEQDLATRGALREVLAAVAAVSGGDLVVDLSGVTFLDATILGVLVVSRRVLGDQDRGLWLRAPPRGVRRLLDLCGLGDLVPVAP